MILSHSMIRMRRTRFPPVALLMMAATSASVAETIYCPPAAGEWERREPEAVGLNRERLDAAIDYAHEHETPVPRDLGAYLAGRYQGPDDEIVGPTRPRGGMSGMVLRNGYLVADFGDTRRVDMTFSVTKSFLSTLAALALDEGLIEDLDDPVRDYVAGEYFNGAHNAQITWHHLLQQTSEWQGTLWGKPDTADRRRGRDRQLQAPGTFWEYNDVRVNLTSFALLTVWQRPLPDVLKERLMDPIGASDAWEWHGYRTSQIQIGGREVKSVSGGGHWGGGLWIATVDQARFGLLFLNRGDWCGRRIIDSDWVTKATTPGGVNPTYGYMWWLNPDKLMWPDVPADSYAARGHGGNIIWIYPQARMVVVVRWIDRDEVNAFLSRIAQAIVE